METLWLCGPSGIGKSVTGWALWSRVVAAGIPAGFVDIDQFGMCYPEQPDDPGRFRLQARNLAGVIAGFRSAGARCLVVAGCVDPRRGVHRDEPAGLDPTVCLLTADDTALARRFVGREGNDDNLAPQLRESAILSTATFPDLVVDTTGRTVPEAAEAILTRTGWPALTPAGHGPPRLIDARPSDLGGDVLWVSGATGTGKSSAAFPVHLRLLRDGIANAYVDLDQLAICGPTPASHEIRARNLAAVWANYRQAGAQALVMVGPAPDDTTVRTYADALPGARVTLRRLHATPDTLTDRILRRGRGEGGWNQPGDPLLGRSPAYLHQVAEQAARDAHALEAAGVGDRVDTDGRSIAEVADALHASMNW
ncbi:hypothetical protein [Actinoplanes sp. HUAS TT8]|uniref:hypothetical protein n=1 Tax=Actinoplanes sp. HUAS TT8 TaxID=3447453 RepID=UPI003F5235C1